jgi:acetolactate decarboxylase
MSPAAPDREPNGACLHVTAPINALVEGLYEQNATVAQVLALGDFGLGTFNDLDGEMVVLDGLVYQLRDDGRAHAVPPDTRTPFACVCRFRIETEEEIAEPLDHRALFELLDSLLPSRNMLYALRIEGHFDHVRVRSVPRQDAYRPLVEVTRDQREFEHANVNGSLVGFWTPTFLGTVAVPGWHFHFLTQDHRHGGHLLECHAHGLRIAMQHIPRLELTLPMTLDYLTAHFGRNVQSDLNEAER